MENARKEWANMNNTERVESFNRYVRVKIAEAITNGCDFWKNDRDAQDIQKTRPYNAQTGKPYNGINSIILESMQQKLGYKNNAWITLKQANFLRVKIPYGTKGIKTSYVKTHDSIPKLDKNGNQIFDVKKLEKPILETTTLFNVEQIPNLSKNKIKTMDSQTITKLVNLKNANLLDSTKAQIEAYIKAQNNKESYRVPQQKTSLKQNYKKSFSR